MTTKGSKGYSGLGLGHLGTLSEHHAAMKVRPKGTAGGKRSKNKGKRGERQVRDLWRSHGWPGAYLQPGSGSVRRYAGEGPVLPADIAGVLPWMVEVKWDERAMRPSRGGGWPGKAFVATVLGNLEATWRSATPIGGRLLPVAFIRGSTTSAVGIERAWRVWVPEPLWLADLLGNEPAATVNGHWVEVSVADYFGSLGKADRVW